MSTKHSNDKFHAEDVKEKSDAGEEMSVAVVLVAVGVGDTRISCSFDETFDCNVDFSMDTSTSCIF